jgi:hypothetical protein
MRYFLSKAIPPFSRVLLVESGSRQIFEKILVRWYEAYPQMKADLVTCYGGVPQNFRPDRGAVYRVTDYPDAESRQRLFQELARNHYTIVAILCSAEPIMTKWKWMLAARLRGKVLVVNENSDYFWLDRGQLAILWQLISIRAGFTGSGAVRTLVRLVLFPFTLLYLILYAVTVHLRRKLRTL